MTKGVVQPRAGFPAAEKPCAVSVHIGHDFTGEGDGEALARLYERATLYRLLGHAVLACAALSLSALACGVVILAPADRAGLVPWVAAPAAIAACGLGGFALFKLTAGPAGVAISGEAEHNNVERRA